MRREIFGAKLEELDAAMAELCGRTRLAQRASPEALDGEIGVLRQKCARDEAALRFCGQTARLPAMRRLAEAELELYEVARQLAQAIDAAEGDPEMESLCAEFVMDAARHAAEHAQLAALVAIRREEIDEGEERM